MLMCAETCVAIKTIEWNEMTWFAGYRDCQLSH